jgi:hypothetical protein
MISSKKSSFLTAASLHLVLFPKGGVSSMQSLKMGSANPGPTYWETDAPPSSVLGVGEKVPSGNYMFICKRLFYDIEAIYRIELISDSVIFYVGCSSLWSCFSSRFSRWNLLCP